MSISVRCVRVHSTKKKTIVYSLFSNGPISRLAANRQSFDKEATGPALAREREKAHDTRGRLSCHQSLLLLVLFSLFAFSLISQNRYAMNFNIKEMK